MFKVHGLGPNWRNTQKMHRYQRTTDDEELDGTSNESHDDDDPDENLNASLEDKKQDADDFLCNKSYISRVLIYLFLFQ